MEQTQRSIRDVAVCVIGGAGFLGSHLVNHLIDDRNCDVLVIDNLITGQKKWLHPKAKFEWCDITHSESQIRRLFEKYNIQYVFNYAAEPYIPVSFQRPVHVFDINARGALLAMNAAQDAGVKGFLQVSSAEIYGDANGVIDEEHKVRPHSTYGASKSAIDSLVQARWKEAKTPAIALRQFNCVGERETHEYIIPVIIDQIDTELKKGIDRPTVRLGNNTFRDFQYAGDAVRMATELLEKGNFGEIYNMGSEEGIMMYDLAHLIAKLIGVEIDIEVDESRKRPWEIWHLQSDNSRLFSVISYRPKVKLEEALKKTITDYQQNGWIYK